MQYLITSASHAAPHWAAKAKGLIITVKHDNHAGVFKGFYCTNPELGCSRTYDVSSPVIAITRFMREHGYYLIYARDVSEED